MNLHEFVYSLHYDTEKAKPAEWEADWDDAPLPFKLYRRLPAFPLSAEPPMRLDGRTWREPPKLSDIGHLLWYSYGIVQAAETEMPPEFGGRTSQTMRMYKRVVPSGGALYPNELYVYWRGADAPAGVYHYDAAHHRLILLREGDFDEYLAAALGHRCRISDCFAVVFVSTMYWKNFFKYHNFSYRLQGLDTGVLTGQLLEAAKRFGCSPGVFFQYLDRAVNHLLGLQDGEETVYAVIPLSMKSSSAWMQAQRDTRADVSAQELCRSLEPLHHEHWVRSRKVADYPLPLRMNEASRQDTAALLRPVAEEGHPPILEHQRLRLPEVNRLSYDFAKVSRKRHSPEADFILGSISRKRLAGLLHEAAESYRYPNDLDGGLTAGRSRVSLYVCAYGAEDIENGAYRYDSESHSLVLLRAGDHRYRLQAGMSLHNVNLFQVPLCFHVAGDAGHLSSALGCRGYRIQQMEAGMLAQRLLLAASASGWGGRPLLGYDVPNCDDLYGLRAVGRTALLQIPVGPYRRRARLEGGLFR